MSVQNGERLVTKQDLSDFYDGIRPYMGGMPEVLANKFSKGDLYSTDEKMIGQWIDGKPLYQIASLDAFYGTISHAYNTTANGERLYTKTFKGTAKIKLYDMIAKTNTTNNEGYISIKLNSTVISKTYLTTNTDMSLNDLIIDAEANDVLSIYFYWDNSHTSVKASFNGKISVPYIPDVDMMWQYGNGVLKYTKTTDSSISIGDDTDYSTEEKIVGTWIDGKPIYQKTINFGALPNNTTKQVAHGISDIATIVDIQGIAQPSNSSQANPLNYVAVSSSTWSIGMYIKGTNIEIETKQNYSGFNAYVTIKYTKTTD